MKVRSGIFLGLGSNMGEREQALERSLALLEDRGFGITARSSFYLTEPVGGPKQDWYVNAVVQGETALSPEELLLVSLGIERELGRTRLVKNGPRTLDIDLLLYGDLVRQTRTLEVPHPRLHERLFVLLPLCEIAPFSLHPGLGLTASELRLRCMDPSRVLLHHSAAKSS